VRLCDELALNFCASRTHTHTHAQGVSEKLFWRWRTEMAEKERKGVSSGKRTLSLSLSKNLRINSDRSQEAVFNWLIINVIYKIILKLFSIFFNVYFSFTNEINRMLFEVAIFESFLFLNNLMVRIMDMVCILMLGHSF